MMQSTSRNSRILLYEKYKKFAFTYGLLHTEETTHYRRSDMFSRAVVTINETISPIWNFPTIIDAHHTPMHLILRSIK